MRILNVIFRDNAQYSERIGNYIGNFRKIK